jgi:hypothetical protein
MAGQGEKGPQEEKFSRAGSLGPGSVRELLKGGFLEPKEAWAQLVFRLQADEKGGAAEALLGEITGWAAPLAAQVEALYLAAARALREGGVYKSLYETLARSPAAICRASPPKALGGGEPQTVMAWLMAQPGGRELARGGAGRRAQGGGGPAARRRRAGRAGSEGGRGAKAPSSGRSTKKEKPPAPSGAA